MGRALTEPLPAGVLEIRSIRVGVVVLKAVHSGFYGPGKLEVGGASRDSTGFGALEEGLISS